MFRKVIPYSLGILFHFHRVKCIYWLMVCRENVGTIGTQAWEFNQVFLIYLYGKIFTRKSGKDVTASTMGNCFWFLLSIRFIFLHGTGVTTELEDNAWYIGTTVEPNWACTDEKHMESYQSGLMRMISTKNNHQTIWYEQQKTPHSWGFLFVGRWVLTYISKTEKGSNLWNTW